MIQAKQSPWQGAPAKVNGMSEEKRFVYEAIAAEKPQLIHPDSQKH